MVKIDPLGFIHKGSVRLSYHNCEDLLWKAFNWASSPQGDRYWREKATRGEKASLPLEDKQLLLAALRKKNSLRDRWILDV